MEEKIICIKKEIISGYLNQSKVFYDENLLNNILNNFQVISRSEAEKNYGCKQIIVYILIKSGDLYLTYRRTAKTNEQRLREKYSIGIGGHVNINDTVTLFDYENKKELFLEAVWREIKEEINIKSKIIKEPGLICYINDDSVDVGKVHLGTVWLLEIEQPIVSIRGEKGIGKLKFEDLSNLQTNKKHFETWSQLLIDYFKTQKC